MPQFFNNYLIIEHLEFEIYLVFGFCNLEFLAWNARRDPRETIWLIGGRCKCSNVFSLAVLIGQQKHLITWPIGASSF
jgi:hypothetical protein